MGASAWQNLTHPVRPEVEEERGIALAEAAGAAGEHVRLDELVGDTCLVARGHGSGRGRGAQSDGLDDARSGALGAIVAAVPIHRPVAALHRRKADRRPAPLSLERLEQGRALGRGHVAAIGERVHPDAIDAVRDGGACDRAQVVDVRVDAPIRDQPEQVQRSTVQPAPRHRPPSARRCSRSSRRPRHRRHARGPGARPAPRRGSGARPRCCPSVPRAAPRRARSRRASSAGRPRSGRRRSASPRARRRCPARAERARNRRG